MRLEIFQRTLERFLLLFGLPNSLIPKVLISLPHFCWTVYSSNGKYPRSQSVENCVYCANLFTAPLALVFVVVFATPWLHKNAKKRRTQRSGDIPHLGNFVAGSAWNSSDKRSVLRDDIIPPNKHNYQLQASAVFWAESTLLFNYRQLSVTIGNSDRLSSALLPTGTVQKREQIISIII